MEVRDFSQTNFVDIFGSKSTQQTEDKPTNFGMGSQDIDILGGKQQSSTTDTTTIAASTTDTTTVAASTTDTTTVDPEKQQQSADILGNNEAGKSGPGRKPKNNFDDISGYFQDRLKTGKFVQIQEEDENGQMVDFVPKNPEDFDRVIELQIEHQLNKKYKDVETNWYSSKSPAWQAVAKYADLVDDPSLLVPFLQGVKNLQSISEVDETSEQGAEAIVRARMERRGDPEEVINSQVESLKTAGKILEAAKQFKPLMINEEQQELVRQQREAQLQQQNWLRDVSEIEDAAIKAIESPIFGNKKITRDEKSAIYEMIGTPKGPDGYQIFQKIDSLFEKRDAESMNMLVQIALLLSKKDAFYNYLGSSAAERTAAGLQRKLQVASASKGGAATGAAEDDKEIITLNKFNRNPRFGSF